MRIWLALLLASSLWSCSDTQEFRALPPGSTVLAFGDSVTHGTGAGSGEDYPSRLAELSGWQVINAGIPGDTADRARGRLGGLLSTHQPELVIIELGGNDFLRKRRASQVQENLEELIKESQASGATTVLVAVPRLSMLRASVGALEDSPIYADLAESTGVLLIDDVFSDVLSDEALRADPIHPNAEGYRVLAGGLAEQLAAAGLLNR